MMRNENTKNHCVIFNDAEGWKTDIIYSKPYVNAMNCYITPIMLNMHS